MKESLQNWFFECLPLLNDSATAQNEDHHDNTNNDDDELSLSTLLFLIDRTGSMSEWITAVQAVLPSLVHSVAVTDMFDRIGILTYSDYDMAPSRVLTFSGLCNTHQTADMQRLADFASHIPCEGGAGCPEAFKTAVLAIAAAAAPHHMGNARRMHVLHLTDAPPHVGDGRLDNEGHKESQHLGEMFEWQNIVDELVRAHPTLSYSALVTCSHQLYSHLAQVTGGSVHYLQGRVTSSNIRLQLGRLLNGWVGHSDCTVGNKQVLQTQPTSGLERDVMKCNVGNATDVGVDPAPPVCTVVSTALRKALRKMRMDGAYREHVISEMNTILELDAMALTISPIVGQIWRELCKARADPRRDEMLAVLNKAKAKLGAADRTVLDEWLRDSYNVESEINEYLLEFMKAHETRGLLHFVPENDNLCSQQIVHLLARGDKKSTAVVRAILSRMLVDKNISIPMVTANNDDVVEAEEDPTVVSSSDDDNSFESSDSSGPATTAHASPITTMLKDLSTQSPHFRTALVIIPPAEITERCNAIRAQYNDQAFPRWMPHITLLFPFHNPKEFPKVIEILRAATANPEVATRLGFPSAPFSLQTSKVAWLPGRKASLHLRPQEVGSKKAGKNSRLQAIYNALLSLFPNMKRSDRDGFHPHLTLGQCPGTQAETTVKEMQEIWDASSSSSNTFDVDEIHLIAHLDGEETYQVMESFKLPHRIEEVDLVRAGKKLPFQLPNGAISPMKKGKDEILDNWEEDAVPPLPKGTIPMNLPIERFFELIMHTVAPGTKLTRRCCALLAMHSIQCGSVLSDLAREYLTSIRGRWINWRRKENDPSMAAEVPENFSFAFLQLLTNDNVVKYSCTNEELIYTQFILKVSRVLRSFFHGLEVKVRVWNWESADRILPDHAFVCLQCSKTRPLSLIDENGICGYCHRGIAETMPPMDPSAQLQVRCFECGSFYARNAQVRILGHSKCHGCQHMDHPSPSIECKICNNHIVQWYKTEEGLPNGTCGPCASGCPPRRLEQDEHLTLAHKIFSGQDHFLALCNDLGLEHVDTTDASDPRIEELVKDGFVFNVSTSVADAVLLLKEKTGNTLESMDGANNTAIPGRDKIQFRSQSVLNLDEVWEFVKGVMAGTTQPLVEECAVCMTIPTRNEDGADGRDASRLFPSCGRRGCHQRVCLDCSRSWYGMNRPGHRLYTRSCFCQFCARAPTRQVTRRVAPLLQGLIHRTRVEPLEPHLFEYAWCRQCFRPTVLQDRACGVEAGVEQQEIANFTCEDCRQPQTKVENDEECIVITKDCPSCGVTTEKLSGCNHITCTSCQQHWCWGCAAFHSDTAQECYNHMEEVHGGIFDFGGNDGDDEDEEEGEDIYEEIIDEN